MVIGPGVPGGPVPLDQLQQVRQVVEAQQKGAVLQLSLNALALAVQLHSGDSARDFGVPDVLNTADIFLNYIMQDRSEFITTEE